MKKYTYEDFLEIIKTLRSENGCPWDREQTHMSLRPCMMEEAAEVLAGIRLYDQTGDYDNLREELGDVLLQVVMHAQIADEEGIFTMEDVVHEVAEKMIRRHPHVFGEAVADNSRQALDNWEEIKRQEKEGRKHEESPLREIPLEFPALARAVKVLKKEDKLYGTGRDYASATAELERVAKALRECESGCDSGETAGLVGDALLALADISRLCRLYPEQILADRIDAVISRHDV